MMDERRAKGTAQAKRLRAAASAGGLRFNCFLPSDLADWVLGMVADGIFADPGEAVFVILCEHRELKPHRDLREELQRRMVQAAMDDPRPSIPHEEVLADIERWKTTPRAAPAQWTRSAG